MGCRLDRVLVTTLVAMFAGLTQQAAAQDSRPQESRAVTTVKLVSGAALALGMHEGGHLLFDAIFDAEPYVKKVDFAGIPFFAITHRSDLSPRREFTIDSAGFWVQEASNEWLLARRPSLRQSHAPLLKGMFTFNVVASLAYAFAAFAEVGPGERDTRGMAASIGVNERVVGLIVLTPAILDAYRYFHPDSAWARWTSRGVKVAGVALVLK